MTLFDDTEIFNCGNRGKTCFEVPDADLMLVDRFFTKGESDRYYTTLLAQTPWQQYEMPMYDKTVTAPRMIAWYGEINRADRLAYKEWPDELLEIKARVEQETGLHFNAVLLNLYRDGNDGVGWHSDKTRSSNTDMNIASVTFGETRIFRLRHKQRKDTAQLEIPLHHGALLLMAGRTNTFWEHQVPKTARAVLPRINLTFRQVK